MSNVRETSSPDGGDTKKAMNKPQLRTQRLYDLRSIRDHGEFSDIRIIVGSTSFDLHKLPLIIHCEFFRGLCRSGMKDGREVHLTTLPGGASTFSLVADYCYGKDIEIDHTNVVALRCAAEFLQMTSHDNLISETELALSQFMDNAQRDPSCLAHVLRDCCLVGEEARHINIVTACFAALMKIWEFGQLPDVICEATKHLPLPWFMDLLTSARDQKLSIAEAVKLVTLYLSAHVQEHSNHISKFLELGVHSEYLDIGIIMDSLLLELPEEAELDEIMTDNLLQLLYRLSVKLSCKCKTVLIRAFSKKIHRIPGQMLVEFTCDEFKTICEYLISNEHQTQETLCSVVDEYLRTRVKQNTIALDEFRTLTRVLPKDHRRHHDTLLVIIEDFFRNTMDLSDDQKLDLLEVVDPQKLHEETLKIASGNAIIPSSFIFQSALSVASHFHSELTRVKSELADKTRALDEKNHAIRSIIEGQWYRRSVTINVTPRNTDNTDIQLVKVTKSGETPTSSCLQHDNYEGKMTMCVRKMEETPEKEWFLFNPFTEELVEIKHTKHNTLIVADKYQKKNKAAYWPFDVCEP